MTVEKTTDDDAGNDVQTQEPDGGLDRSLMFADDGKLWREKFQGARGHAQQLRTEKEKLETKYEGAVEEHQSTVGELKSEIESRDGVIDELNERIGDLSGVQDRLEELRQVNETLESKAAVADRYRTLMEYPHLLNMTVTDTVEVDGEEHEVVANPVLDLVENTNLDPDQLRTHIKRLSQAIGQGEEVDLDASNVTKGAAPEPGEPVDETPESLRAEARKIHKGINAGEGGDIEEMQDLYRRARELE